ncbi:MAG: SDR family oxidoreductase [Deltaproteobacteria bacterium]|nr:SDR family oxidoreductase [Deltaproteobacteria bacterium]
MKLEKKIALITGAGSGIGRASAILFSKEGAKIAVADIDEKGGQRTVEIVNNEGGSAIFIKTDVTKESDVRNMIKKTVEDYGRLDILYNNAGIGTHFIMLEDTEESLWDRVMAINVKGVFFGCKYAAPVMKKQGGGVIVNTASIAAVRPRPGLSAYSASKAAVIALTRSAAMELAPFNIRVNCINPVVTDTPFLVKTVPADKMDEAKKTMLATIPLGRMGQPEDIAKAALYLASDDSSLVTGIGLDVDGGRGV